MNSNSQLEVLLNKLLHRGDDGVLVQFCSHPGASGISHFDAFVGSPRAPCCRHGTEWTFLEDVHSVDLIRCK